MVGIDALGPVTHLGRIDRARTPLRCGHCQRLFVRAARQSDMIIGVARNEVWVCARIRHSVEPVRLGHQFMPGRHSGYRRDAGEAMPAVIQGGTAAAQCAGFCASSVCARPTACCDSGEMLRPTPGPRSRDLDELMTTAPMVRS
jgi:hypothetical protein